MKIRRLQGQRTEAVDGGGSVRERPSTCVVARQPGDVGNGILVRFKTDFAVGCNLRVNRFLGGLEQRIEATKNHHRRNYVAVLTEHKQGSADRSGW